MLENRTPSETEDAVLTTSHQTAAAAPKTAEPTDSLHPNNDDRKCDFGRHAVPGLGFTNAALEVQYCYQRYQGKVPLLIAMCIASAATAFGLIPSYGSVHFDSTTEFLIIVGVFGVIVVVAVSVWHLYRLYCREAVILPSEMEVASLLARRQDDQQRHGGILLRRQQQRGDEQDHLMSPTSLVEHISGLRALPDDIQMILLSRLGRVASVSLNGAAASVGMERVLGTGSSGVSREELIVLYSIWTEKKFFVRIYEVFATLCGTILVAVCGSWFYNLRSCTKRLVTVVDDTSLDPCSTRVAVLCVVCQTSIAVLLNSRALISVPLVLLCPIVMFLPQLEMKPNSVATTDTLITQIFAQMVCTAVVVVVALTLDRKHRDEFVEGLHVDREVLGTKRLQARVDQILEGLMPRSILSRVLQLKPVVDESLLVVVGLSEVFDFAKWSTTMLPIDVVNTIGYLYQVYDNLTGECEVDKHKVVGDRYMVTCGLLSSVIREANDAGRVGCGCSACCEFYNSATNHALVASTVHATSPNADQQLVTETVNPSGRNNSGTTPRNIFSHPNPSPANIGLIPLAGGASRKDSKLSTMDSDRLGSGRNSRRGTSESLSNVVPPVVPQSVQFTNCPFEIVARALEFATRQQDCVRDINRKIRGYLEPLRTTTVIHCGPVIGAMVGKYALSYEVVGPTIDVAFQLTLLCKPDKIMISALASEFAPNASDAASGRGDGISSRQKALVSTGGEFRLPVAAPSYPRKETLHLHPLSEPLELVVGGQPYSMQCFHVERHAFTPLYCPPQLSSRMSRVTALLFGATAAAANDDGAPSTATVTSASLPPSSDTSVSPSKERRQLLSENRFGLSEVLDASSPATTSDHHLNSRLQHSDSLGLDATDNDPAQGDVTDVQRMRYCAAVRIVKAHQLQMLKKLKVSRKRGSGDSGGDAAFAQGRQVTLVDDPARIFCLEGTQSSDSDASVSAVPRKEEPRWVERVQRAQRVLRSRHASRRECRVAEVWNPLAIVVGGNVAIDETARRRSPIHSRRATEDMSSNIPYVTSSGANQGGLNQGGRELRSASIQSQFQVPSIQVAGIVVSDHSTATEDVSNPFVNASQQSTRPQTLSPFAPPPVPQRTSSFGNFSSNSRQSSGKFRKSSNASLSGSALDDEQMTAAGTTNPIGREAFDALTSIFSETAKNVREGYCWPLSSCLSPPFSLHALEEAFRIFASRHNVVWRRLAFRMYAFFFTSFFLLTVVDVLAAQELRRDHSLALPVETFASLWRGYGGLYLGLVSLFVLWGRVALDVAVTRCKRHNGEVFVSSKGLMGRPLDENETILNSSKFMQSQAEASTSAPSPAAHCGIAKYEPTLTIDLILFAILFQTCSLALGAFPLCTMNNGTYYLFVLHSVVAYLIAAKIWHVVTLVLWAAAATVESSNLVGAAYRESIEPVTSALLLVLFCIITAAKTLSRDRSEKKQFELFCTSCALLHASEEELQLQTYLFTLILPPHLRHTAIAAAALKGSHDPRPPPMYYHSDLCTLEVRIDSFSVSALPYSSARAWQIVKEADKLISLVDSCVRRVNAIAFTELHSASPGALGIGERSPSMDAADPLSLLTTAAGETTEGEQSSDDEALPSEHITEAVLVRMQTLGDTILVAGPLSKAKNQTEKESGQKRAAKATLLLAGMLLDATTAPVATSQSVDLNATAANAASGSFVCIANDLSKLSAIASFGSAFSTYLGSHGSCVSLVGYVTRFSTSLLRASPRGFFGCSEHFYRWLQQANIPTTQLLPSAQHLPCAGTSDSTEPRLKGQLDIRGDITASSTVPCAPKPTSVTCGDPLKWRVRSSGTVIVYPFVLGRDVLESFPAPQMTLSR